LLAPECQHVVGAHLHGSVADQDVEVPELIDHLPRGTPAK
jgi:hypothetical protein